MQKFLPRRRTSSVWRRSCRQPSTMSTTACAPCCACASRLRWWPAPPSSWLPASSRFPCQNRMTPRRATGGICLTSGWRTSWRCASPSSASTRCPRPTTPRSPPRRLAPSPRSVLQCLRGEKAAALWAPWAASQRRQTPLTRLLGPWFPEGEARRFPAPRPCRRRLPETVAPRKRRPCRGSQGSARTRAPLRLRPLATTATGSLPHGQRAWPGTHLL
mmetsp:Transcript_22526/g.62494  ORF Transcript_22526/g.62494 Transcript_22526/m.62494 type:complete len:217 (-) Transcript_22526:1020-1670(-)